MVIRDEEGRHKWWVVPLEFFLHVLSGTVVFIVVAAAAVALDFVVSWLGTKGVSPFILISIRTAEIVLLGFDLWMYAYFLFGMTKEAMAVSRWQKSRQKKE